MASSQQDRIFAIVHQAWERLPVESIGSSIHCWKLRGGGGETWRVRIEPGGVLASTRGLPAECFVTVLEGKLRLQLFGNEVELPAGHVADVPPNVPFSLRLGARSAATLLLGFCDRLDEPVPLEAL